MRIRVRPTAASTYKTHGEFTVARLLIEHHAGPLPKGTVYENTCGLSQCVNPAHWASRTPSSPWRMQVRDDGAWQLARVTTGEPADRLVVARVLHRGVVHVVAVEPQARRDLAPPQAACGQVLVPDECAVTGARATCEGCR